MLSSFIKKFSLLLMVFAMTLFISCKEEKTKTPDGAETTTSETIEKTSENSEATGSNVALNPAHGQPGHRCDIKVGDPLPEGSATSSPVIKSQQSPVIKSTGNVPVNGSNTNTATSGNVNPAHGQPGHRCDIPVGTPLD